MSGSDSSARNGSAAPTKHVTRIDNVTLIDGTGAAPRPRTSIVIRGERIEWIGPTAEAKQSHPADTVVDAGGQAALPGLIDAHIHISRSGRTTIQELLQQDRDRLLLEAVASARSVLRSGTTAVRDVGTLDYIELSLKWAIEQGMTPGPRMRTSGRFLSITGGHAHLTARQADSPDEFRKAAREQIRRGADNIKLMATGGLATAGQDVQASQMSVDEMRAAVQAAHAFGCTVAAHCHGVGGIRDATLAGVDSIEHGTFLDEETADLMAERGTALVLTAGSVEVDLSTLSPAARAQAERMQAARPAMQEHLQRAVALARSAGLLIGAGSDAGGNPLAPHEFSMAHEIQALVAHGFTPLQAIAVATGNNARILRWAGDLGTLAPGKLADIVLLAGDPTEDLANLFRVEAVYKGGQRQSA